ncbi:hypothetical protein A0H81_12679 [Grifola frondosa]|uniref:DUF6533 domain-containing protein n=1 Tax=Grifola frondosa TaxID=5627 RepID=A0A1C7LRR8_GRIFR|nr:hypothetical protein A0H81_12679 [Grifola frondosa]
MPFINAANHVQAYGQYIGQTYVSTAARTLTIFDYLLTFDVEVQCIWNAPFSGVTLLFFVNRYINVVVTVFVFLSMTIFEPSPLM